MISFEPLKKTLKERGLSCRKLFHQLGYSGGSHNTYMMLAHGSLSFLNDICRALDCDVDDVICNVDKVVKDERVSINWERFEGAVKNGGYTLTSISREIGMAGDALTSLKKRNGKPLMSNLNKLCKIINCKAEEFIND